MSLSPAPPETESTSLRGGRLGVVGIVFYVIAAASPLVGMTGALPVAIVLGNGAAVPGAYLAVGIVLLLFSVGYAAMSQRVTNTGAFFAYVGRGLGIGPGVGSAYDVPGRLPRHPAGHLRLLRRGHGQPDERQARHRPAVVGLDACSRGPWCWLLSAFSVDVGAKVLGVLMLLEIGSLALVSIAVFIQGGPEGVDFAASVRSEEHLRRRPDRLRRHRARPSPSPRSSASRRPPSTARSRRTRSDRSRSRPTWRSRSSPSCSRLTTFAVITALGASQCRRARRSSARRWTASRSPTRPQVIFSVAREYVGGWLADADELAGARAACSPGCSPSRTPPPATSSRWAAPACCPRALDRVNKAGAPAARLHRHLGHHRCRDRAASR